ncbi:hypothetical protein [Helicobacter valdiviensis]|nr:hypothetical protein [Helicobacter valdiviensis]
MASLNLKGDYGVEILSYYLWGESTPPGNLAKKALLVIQNNIIPKDKQNA